MERQKVKCVVWDLDQTLWEGILIEDKQVVIKDHVVEVIKELDRRGILQSVSSKNEYQMARQRLMESGLWDYFIYPQINWNSKSEAISQIAQKINIGIDTFCFIDDQEFEREEVSFTHPEVLCIDAGNIGGLLDMDCLNPKYITEDSKKRRQMYQNDIKRNQQEEVYTGTKEAFLETLEMCFKIERAQEEDLQRAEELTVRTHQLNSTGYIYSYEELKGFINSGQHDVFVAQLDDKFGTYGKIGLALIEKQQEIWEIKLLLMSCRVMSKGVGNVFLNHLINEAGKYGKTIRAQFIPTDKNRIMYVTYKFNGFKEIGQKGDVVILEADTSYPRVIPHYVNLIYEEGDI